jgi:2-methylcitrate dehydratase PrpD
MSFAAHFAGGLGLSMAAGSDEWRAQIGMASYKGLVAAQYAAAGMPAAADAIGGKAGVADAFAGMIPDWAGSLADLGLRWSILEVLIKPYPACTFNQTPIKVAEEARHTIPMDRITAVTVRMNPYESGYWGMSECEVVNSFTAAVMSVPFCIATTLLRGAPDVRDMLRPVDGQTRELMRRVSLESDPSVPPLSVVIEFDCAGEVTRIEHRTAADDYRTGRAGILQAVKRIGTGEGVDEAAFDRLDEIVRDLGAADAQAIVALFCDQAYKSRNDIKAQREPA